LLLLRSRLLLLQQRCILPSLRHGGRLSLRIRPWHRFQLYLHPPLPGLIRPRRRTPIDAFQRQRSHRKIPLYLRHTPHHRLHRSRSSLLLASLHCQRS
jgi:hypothetical protein